MSAAKRSIATIDGADCKAACGRFHSQISIMPFIEAKPDLPMIM
jgi:hypothetical protein